MLATFRLTELFVQDRITDKLRKKLNTYLLSCLRCMSVWAGIFCALSFVYFPWLNWPFALSWLYFVHNDLVYGYRLQKQGRQFTLAIKGPQWEITRNELSQAELQQILSQVATQQRPAGAPD
jgi:hypothetical protein